MKTMKKFLMVLLGAALVLSMAGAGMADQTTITQTTSGDKTAEATASVTITSTYTVTIPTAIAVGTTVNVLGADHTLSISDVLLKDDEQVTVTVKSENSWSLKHTNTAITTDNTITYELYDGESTKISGTGTDYGSAFLTVGQTDKNGKSATLKAKYIVNPTYGGTYEDTLTFQVTLGTTV